MLFRSKRVAQRIHSRRRRTLFSVGRESITLLSSQPHSGHLIIVSPSRKNIETPYICIISQYFVFFNISDEFFEKNFKKHYFLLKFGKKYGILLIVKG